MEMKGFKFKVADKQAKRVLTASKLVGKRPEATTRYASSTTSSSKIIKEAQWDGMFGGGDVNYSTPSFFSILHTPINWQIPSKRREAHQWCRFLYDNEPKIAAGIDFYAQFPMNNFKLQCKSKKVLKFFERLIKKIKLNYWLKIISHEYFLLGDVFVFVEVDCHLCGGSGIKPNGEACNHPNGNIKRLVVLNPDWIEVIKNPIASDPVIALIPDEELKLIVQKKQPLQIYNKLPKRLIDLVMSNQPIPLSNRCVSHLKHNECGYGVYGTPFIRRLFVMAAYKIKLMTANWIVADRLILPVRVVKVGDKDRPASPEDLQDVSNQLTAVENNPSLTLVTHHAFEYDWIGAEGKIHNITGEMEMIGKEMLDGLMLNQALLNGEAGSYSSAQVGVETLIRRLQSWQDTLSEWVEEKIFLPIAMMQGFIDEEESKEAGETVYLHPKMKWNDLNLRDKTNKLQALMQLQEKNIISKRKLLEEFDIDYDQELERIREEQIPAGPGGAVMGAGGGGGGLGGLGGLGGMGGAPGGAPPMGGEPMGGDMGAAGGMPGMDASAPMGASPMGDAAGGMGAAAGSMPSLKVGRRSKGKTAEEQLQAPKPTAIQLTSLEAQLYKALQDLEIPYQLYGQYKVALSGEKQPFMIDFAYPTIGIGIEADGSQWHERADLKAKDMQRDQKLANVGWRILRFKEDAINDRMEDVKKVVYQNIYEAAKERREKTKHSSVKTAQTEEGKPTNLIKCQIEAMSDGLGDIVLLGE